MLLPQELIDRIIDQLHEDKSALASCALVNKQWVYRSHYHLFHTITLRADKEYIIDKFLDSIHCQIPRIRPFYLDVRHIRFFQHTSRPFPECEQSTPLSHKLVSRLAFFPNVHALTISVGGPIETTTSSILHSVFGHVTKLALRGLQFPDISKMTFLLSGFPALEVLDLQVDFVTRYSEEEQHLQSEYSIPVFASLRSLQLDSWPSKALYPWFSSHQRLPKLTCLALVLDDHDPKHIGNLLAKFGPQLEKLRLYMDDLPDPSRFARALELWKFDSLTNLRCIAIQWLQHDIPMFLSSVLPCLPALEVIQLGIRINYRTDLCNILPPELLEVLERFGTGQLNKDRGTLFSCEGTGTRSRLPELSIVVRMYTFSLDFIPWSMDIIRTGDENAMQKEVRDMERQVKASLPRCEQCGVLDLRIIIGPTSRHLFTLRSLPYPHYVQMYHAW